MSFALGDVTDAAFIGIALWVNSAIGGWQEWRAERQSQSLQKLLRIRASTLRDGERVESFRLCRRHPESIRVFCMLSP